MVTNKAAVCCLLALCCTLAAGTNIKFGNCTDVKVLEGKLISVDITPCPEEPCVFHKGTNVTATITFSPNVMVTDGTLQVYGIIAGIRTPFPLEHPDACENHGIECPLKSHVTYSLNITLEIKPEYPSIQIIAEMKFKLPDDGTLFCFLFPMRIADASVGVTRSKLTWFEISILNAWTVNCLNQKKLYFKSQMEWNWLLILGITCSFWRFR